MLRGILTAILAFSSAMVALAGPESAVQIRCSTFARAAGGKATVAGHWGTGVCVGCDGRESRILTNRHVAPDANAQYAVLMDRGWAPARWVAVDDRADLALLVAACDLPAVGVAAVAPRPGDELRGWGHPEAGPLVSRAGQCVDTTGARDQWGYNPFGASYRIQPGDSGSQVVNAAGELVAIAYASPTDAAPFKAACVHLADIRRFLDTHRGK